MRPNKGVDQSAAGLQPGVGINAGDYSDRACAYVRATPTQLGFVIRAFEGEKGALRTKEMATPAQWLAWTGYLETLGVPIKFMRHQGRSTVPTEWPEDFDATAPSSDRLATMAHPARSPVIAEKTARLMANMLINEMGGPREKPQPKPRFDVNSHAEIDFGKPMTVSKDALEKLGLKPKEDFDAVDF
jgi:hypothetical protein